MNQKYPNGLAAAMVRAGKGPTELANAIGDNKQNITRWARGQRKLPAPKAKALAPLLETTPEELLLPGSETFSRIPLLDWVTAGKLSEPRSQIPVEDMPLLAFADLGRGDFFALKVEGDSMDRVSPEASIIVVNKSDKTLIPGKYYVFWNRGETTYKVWRSGPDRLAPYSTNPANESIFVKGRKSFGVVGRVRRTVLDL